MNHFHFTDWPNYGVPDPEGLVKIGDLIKLVLQTAQESNKIESKEAIDPDSHSVSRGPREFMSPSKFTINI